MYCTNGIRRENMFVKCSFMAYIQENVKQLQDIQNSLVGQFEVIKPGRVSE